MRTPVYKTIALFATCCMLVGYTHVGQRAPMLAQAENLVEHINAGNTEYRHKSEDIAWENNGSGYHCYTDCSGFINALISRTFQWSEEDFKRVFGKRRMLAYHYFEAISSGNHFIRISHINEIKPGDLIALEYSDRSEHEDNTGHCMLVATLPKPRQATNIIEPGTRQYEIEVIDCSRSPHGKEDSRSGNNGREYSGLGKGLFRLYADVTGAITAYSWSIHNPKPGFNPYENAVMVGRFLPGK